MHAAASAGMRRLLVAAATAIACSTLVACGGGAHASRVTADVHDATVHGSTVRSSPVVAPQFRVATQHPLPAGPLDGAATVAAVDGRGIPRAELDHWLGVVARSEKPPVAIPSPGDPNYETMLVTTMDYLVSAAWLELEATRLGVAVTPAGVHAEFMKLRRKQYKSAAALRRLLHRTGETVADLELRVAVEMLSTRIQKKVTQEARKAPTAPEVRRYYEQHESSVGRLERRDLLVILTEGEAEANEAKAEIESGVSFASVARRHSLESASKDEGGELRGVEESQEEKPLAEAVFSAAPDELVGPVKTPFGYYVFEVKRVIAATHPSLDSAERSIAKEIESQKEQAALTKFETHYRDHMTAVTKCASGFVVEDCSNYVKPTEEAR